MQLKKGLSIWLTLMMLFSMFSVMVPASAAAGDIAISFGTLDYSETDYVKVPVLLGGEMPENGVQGIELRFTFDTSKIAVDIGTSGVNNNKPLNIAAGGDSSLTVYTYNSDGKNGSTGTLDVNTSHASGGTQEKACTLYTLKFKIVSLPATLSVELGTAGATEWGQTSGNLNGTTTFPSSLEIVDPQQAEVDAALAALPLTGELADGVAAFPLPTSGDANVTLTWATPATGGSLEVSVGSIVGGNYTPSNRNRKTADNPDQTIELKVTAAHNSAPSKTAGPKTFTLTVKPLTNANLDDIDAQVAGYPTPATLLETAMDYTLPVGGNDVTFAWTVATAQPANFGTVSSGKFVPGDARQVIPEAPAPRPTDYSVVLDLAASKGGESTTIPAAITLTVEPLAETVADLIEDIDAILDATEALSEPTAEQLKTALSDMDALFTRLDSMSPSAGELTEIAALEARYDAIYAAFMALAPLPLAIDVDDVEDGGLTRFTVAISDNTDYVTLNDGNPYDGEFWVVVQVMSGTTPVATFGYSSESLKDAADVDFAISSAQTAIISVVDEFSTDLEGVLVLAPTYDSGVVEE